MSTDEVYGSLGPGDHPFTEDSRYAPNSPYAASKAAGESLARCAAAGARWTLKIARLGPFDTGMARAGSPKRAPGEAAAMLLRLLSSESTTLSYEPATDAYSYGN